MAAMAVRRSIYLVLFLAMVVVGSTLARAISQGRSDSTEFWSLAQPIRASGPAYRSLAELAANSDLIVIGNIESIVRGREWVAIPALKDDPIHGDVAYARFAKATVRVERVLSSAAAPEPLEVEFTVITWDQLADLQKRIPAERSIFFLTQKAPPDDPAYYRLVTIGDAVVRDIEGKASPLVGDSPIGRELAGRSFAGLADAVSLLSER